MRSNKWESHFKIFPGITVEYIPRLDLRKAHEDVDIHAQVREAGTQEDSVELYRQRGKIIDMDTAEPVLVIQRELRFLLIDGYTRKAAFLRAGRTHHDAYKIYARTTKDLDLLIGTWNGITNGPGDAITPTARMATAVHMFNKGHDKAVAARFAQISAGGLSRHLNAREVAQAIKTQGVEFSDRKLPHTVLLKMRTFITRPALLGKLAACLNTGDVSEVERENLITSIKAAPTDSRAISILDEWTARQGPRRTTIDGAVRSRQQSRTTPVTSFMALMAEAKRLAPMVRSQPSVPLRAISLEMMSVLADIAAQPTPEELQRAS